MIKGKVLLLCCIGSFFFSCTDTEPDLNPLSRDEISGVRLWERISTESDYRNYSQWPGHEGKKPGQAPHGVEHQVYANKVLFDALPVTEAPDGTILVKENYNAADEMVKITVMVKVSGFDPGRGDWFWAAMDPDGTVTAEGSPDGCISCHSGMKSNDYIIIQPLNETLSE